MQKVFWSNKNSKIKKEILQHFMEVQSMNYVTVEIIDTVGLNPRERIMLQNTVLNFVAMSNALILKEDVVINPLEQDNENIGVVLVYAKPLNDEQSEAITQALSKRFITYFKMSELDLEALIKVH